MSKRFREDVSEFFRSLQGRICAGLETVDRRGVFGSDRWYRPGGGGGLTRVLEDGGIFEKGGVNYSEVFGELPASIAEKMNISGGMFHANGLSLVLHPRSPMIPTVHANFRYFELEAGDAWFGGGVDLTPCYLFEEDVRHFHSTLKKACDRHDAGYYPKFKKWCDEYFFIRHRNEGRGVGGLFFDYLRDDLPGTFAFVRSIGDAFLPAYMPIVERRRDENWGEDELAWQQMRRGRYVEFNLVYDRGTLFGLETDGRIESILISLPPQASWRYARSPVSGSREEKLVKVLQTPREWAD